MHRSYNIKKYEIHQSRRLPHWVWYLLARFLGIKLHPLDKPIFGTLMIVLTVLFAITYIVSFIWYIAYDIVNEYTKQTVLTGVFSIVMVIYWASLGVYANKLAARLFSSQKFIDSVRLHSRTVFKVSAAGLMIIIAIASTILNNYTSATLYNGERCQNLTVSREVCYVMFGARLGYSIFSLIWNLLVGIVLLSVCRTHTIGKSINANIKMYSFREGDRLYCTRLNTAFMQVFFLVLRHINVCTWGCILFGCVLLPDMGSIPIPLNSIWSIPVPYKKVRSQFQFQIYKFHFYLPFFTYYILPWVGTPNTYSEYLLGIHTLTSLYSK